MTDRYSLTDPATGAGHEIGHHHMAKQATVRTAADATGMDELGRRKPAGAQTVRGLRRRALILKVAAELFAEHGYEGVSINDIGFAAGITGPGIYRYFSGKDVILSSIYEHIYGRNREGVGAILASTASAKELLERYVDHQIDLAIEEPEKIRIISNEERNLPPELADRLRTERRQNFAVIVDLLEAARPDLAAEEVEVAVHCVLALINAASLRWASRHNDAQLARQLRALALAVLEAPSLSSSPTDL
jgi:AcrR family transcriptional regulator